jgi:hypothetical protein
MPDTTAVWIRPATADGAVQDNDTTRNTPYSAFKRQGSLSFFILLLFYNLLKILKDSN